jgi:hypothetical protein
MGYNIIDVAVVVGVFVLSFLSGMLGLGAALPIFVHD